MGEQADTVVDQQSAEAERQSTAGPILRPQHNCWRVEQASGVSVLVDAADYFSAFAQACRGARRQILILGWDFDRRERLHRGDREDYHPDEVGAFLVDLVKRRKGLDVYLLSWDFNMIYAAERELLPALRLRLQAPRRFHFRLDSSHPKGASQHQKVVVIDDRVAFVGGIDLSRWRWDTSAHEPGDPRRTDRDGKAYPPFHDVMMLVEGPVAKKLGDLARERWRRAHGWTIKRIVEQGDSPWPPSVDRQLRSAPVAIARTEPVFKGRPEVREVERLYLDAISSAKQFVYIENQYFTAPSLGAALCDRLGDPGGPEIVLVLPRHTGGWLEQVTMDVLRSRLVGRMLEADRYDRLRIYYPHQPGLEEDECISVHAKLMVVDDRFLRIGSSNTSSRSMGLDSECDLAIETTDPNDDVGGFVAFTRRQLLAEHLDCTPEEVARVENGQGGMIAAIEQLQTDARSLRLLDWEVPGEVDELVPEAGLIDPPEPFSPDYFVDQYVPDESRPTGRRRLLVFATVIVALLVLGAAWRWTPLGQWLAPEQLGQAIASLPSTGVRAVVAVGAFLVASLLMVPLTLLAVVAGVVFPGWEAFFYLLVAAITSSGLGFLGGQIMGSGVVDRLSGSRVGNLSKRLAKHGTLAVALLRLVPVAPFAVLNLMAGASHLNFRQFMVGSFLGLAPGLGAITLFSSTLWGAITNPSWFNFAIAAAVGVALALLAWLVKKWLRSG